MSKMIRNLKWQLGIIQLTVMLSFIGLALPYTIFPLIFVEGQQTHSIVWYSFLISSYPLGQWFGMPIIGYLSDIFGRKKILAITLLLATITFILSGICIRYDYLFWLIIIRFFSGIVEGNSSIAMAMIHDLHDLIDSKLKWFGKINLSLTMGFLIGPFLGSLLSNNKLCSWFDFSVPFYGAAIFYFLAFCIVCWCFVETKKNINQPMNRIHFYKILEIPIKTSYFYLFQSNLRKVLLFSLILTTAADILYQFIPIYLAARWSADSSTLALAVFLLSVGKMIGSGYIINPLFAILQSESKCLLVGLAIITFVLVLLINLQLHYFLGSLLLLGICIAVLITNATTLISNRAALDKQGVVLGVAQSSRVLTSAVFCNLMAISCQISFSSPFLMSLFFFLLAFSLLYRRKFQVVISDQ